MSYRILGGASLSALLTALLTTGAAQADFVINDDLIVDGSACIGFDCVNGESFSFDTIRLKENNLRIKFDDTSVAASFPRTDWQITANSSANGGASKFSIDDISGSRTPFTIEANAPNNSLYVDDGGRVGFGTSSPVAELHTKDGDTPTLRLEQDGASGFAPQTFDVAANETNFFIRDVSNGSTLPFRIRPGAPTSAIDIAGDGDVGIGTGSPSASLHVNRSNGEAKILVTETSGVAAAREMLRFENNGGSYFTLVNSANGGEWYFTHEQNAPNRFIINNSTAPAEGLFLEADGDMTIGGVLTENSDKNAKMAIEAVDPAEVLATLNQLQVARWTYKDDAQAARHMGPMAQDFYALFGLGATEKGISTLDTSGVALAAIQALSAENAELKTLLAAQDARLNALEATQ